MLKITLMLLVTTQVYAQGCSSLIFPVSINESTKVTSDFGYRKHPITKNVSFHSAIDVSANAFDEVYASCDGIISRIDFNENLGVFVVIKHQNGRETWYAHLFGVCAEFGKAVYVGEKIGWVGKTGRATGYHLHFGLKEHGKWKDPIIYLLH